jgi:hypothetical protein
MRRPWDAIERIYRNEGKSSLDLGERAALLR